MTFRRPPMSRGGASTFLKNTRCPSPLLTAFPLFSFFSSWYIFYLGLLKVGFLQLLSTFPAILSSGSSIRRPSRNSFNILYHFLKQPMACPSRFAASLRRASCAPRTFKHASRRLRPVTQVRWQANEATTSASSEPHQPDSEGGVKGSEAKAKSIKFTSDSYGIHPPIQPRVY